METEQLLQMLAMQDAEDEEKKKEIVKERTRVFDPVLRIAEIVRGQRQKGSKFDGNYIEDLTRSFINPDTTKKVIGVQHFFEDLKRTGIHIPKDILERSQQEIKEFVSLLPKEVIKRLETIPETKVPEKIGADHSGERKDSYQTGIGCFLPQDTDSLMAATHIKQSMNGLESVLPRVFDAPSLTRLLFLNQILMTAPEERRKEIYEEIQDQELSEDTLISVATSLEGKTDTLTRIRKLRGLHSARAKAITRVQDRIKNVAEKTIDYRERAERIIYQIYQSTGRVNTSYELVDNRENFETFIKCLESKIMSDTHKVIRPKDSNELRSGWAILTRSMHGLKRGTIGTLSNTIFSPSKGKNAGVSCKEVLKIERIIEGEVIPVGGEPQIGDIVVMNGSNDEWEGSYGYLKENDGIVSRVEFQYITCKRFCAPDTLRVYSSALKKAVFKKEEVEEEQYVPRIHDKVKIKTTSKYAGQNKTEGEIVETDPFNKDLPYIVKFEDGYQNNYSAKDVTVLNLPQDELRRLKDKEKGERIKKKKMKVERNRIRRIIAQNLEDIANTNKERRTEVAGCVEHLIKLGIIPEIAHYVVKYHIEKRGKTYNYCVQQGVLMTDEQSNKIFEKLKKLLPSKEGMYEKALDNIVEEVQKTTGVYIDRSEMVARNEQEVKSLRGMLESLYVNGYVEQDGPKEKSTKVTTVRGHYKGKVLRIDGWRVCRMCGDVYHASFKGDDVTVCPLDIIPLKKLFTPEQISQDEVVPAGIEQLVEGAIVKIRKDSYFADQSKEFGILQGNYTTQNTEEYHLVIFQDGAKYNYRKKDLEVFVRKEGREKDIEEQRTTMIREAVPKMQEIFDRHTTDVKDATQEFRELLTNVHSQFASLGFNNADIATILSEKVPGYNIYEI